MPGVPDQIYVDARRALLDALQALSPHREALVLVGAQAVYLHAGDIDAPIAPFTTDGDVALDPDLLVLDPRVDEAMLTGGFVRTDQPGIWKAKTGDATVDLLVPEGVAPPGGTRGARLGVHGDRTARKVKGLEGAMVDRALTTLHALDPEDDRSAEVYLAGPAALIVAKVYKMHERLAANRPLESKDAFDIYRLLVATSTAELVSSMRMLLADDRSMKVTAEALGYLNELFGAATATGAALAGSCIELFGDGPTTTAASSALASDLLAQLGPGSGERNL
jgi:hypothetical protein